MTPSIKSSLDNGADTFRKCDSKAKPDRTPGWRKGTIHKMYNIPLLSRSSSPLITSWKVKKTFFSTKCHRLFIYIRNSPSGLPSIQYRGQALLKHGVLPHPYENWYLAGNQYTCFNICFWKAELIHMNNFL